MTQLHFRGKEFVHNHHLAVPHRPLVPDASKGVGKPNLSGNLIIQGDNLHALKALLPMYAGEVDCIFIDPPYNTGNEGWCYNDNVSSSMMMEWIQQSAVDKEDGLRHDKWCAMMWPRLKLLHELLADTGSFWMTLDDNEVHRGKLLLDEIFGEVNFVANVVWQKKHTRANDAKWFSDNHDHVLCFAKSKNHWKSNLLPRDAEKDSQWKNEDDDPRGPWASGPCHAKTPSPNGMYEITTPSGKKLCPPAGTSWRFSEAKFKQLIGDNRIYFGDSGNNVPRYKRFLSEVQQGLVPVTLWQHADVGHNQDAKTQITQLGLLGKFDTPKPVGLISQILKIATDENALILDSFAGSGTTAHAVLQANALDGGNRRFILVEMEDHIADAVTAERVRRVINGYEYKGKQKTELHREKLTFTKMKKHDIFDAIDAIAQKYGEQFDKISGEVKNDTLVMYGEDDVKESVKGLGGTFTYCTLGEAIDFDEILSGKYLPSYETFAPVLFHMATGETLDPKGIDEGRFYVGASLHETVWMIYKPDLDWLKSDAAAFTLSFARDVFQSNPMRHHIVFAPIQFVGEKVLREQGLKVSFVPLPYALYRIEREEV